MDDNNIIQILDRIQEAKDSMRSEMQQQADRICASITSLRNDCNVEHANLQKQTAANREKLAAYSVGGWVLWTFLGGAVAVATAAGTVGAFLFAWLGK